MKYRNFGRLAWSVSEIGYGMWGMGGQWKGGTDEEAISSLHFAVDNGINFFDTAWAYGSGHSENLFRDAILGLQKEGKIYVATKVPPKNMRWPGTSADDIKDVYPKEHILEYCQKSLENLGVDCIDLLQLHVWDDSWTESDLWQDAVYDLKRQRLIKGFGLSLNKWEPSNGLKAITTGLIDSIQVVYNIFEQAPEDKLFPECQARNIAVIARVPFDEGSLTGSYNRDTTFDKDDWRSKFYTPRMLDESISRVDKIREILPSDMTLAELSLKFILDNKAISTVIPGMRKVEHVKNNLLASDGVCLDKELYMKLKKFRWDRDPSEYTA